MCLYLCSNNKPWVFEVSGISWKADSAMWRKSQRVASLPKTLSSPFLLFKFSFFPSILEMWEILDDVAKGRCVIYFISPDFVSEVKDSSITWLILPFRGVLTMMLMHIERLWQGISVNPLILSYQSVMVVTLWQISDRFYWLLVYRQWRKTLYLGKGILQRRGNVIYL